MPLDHAHKPDRPCNLHGQKRTLSLNGPVRRSHFRQLDLKTTPQNMTWKSVERSKILEAFVSLKDFHFGMSKVAECRTTMSTPRRSGWQMTGLAEMVAIGDDLHSPWQSPVVLFAHLVSV